MNLKDYEKKAAELLKVLGYEAMAKDILDGNYTALETYRFIKATKAFKSMKKEIQMLIDTALYALEKENKNVAVA